LETPLIEAVGPCVGNLARHVWALKVPDNWTDSQISGLAELFPSKDKYQGKPSHGGLPILLVSASRTELDAALLAEPRVEFVEEDAPLEATKTQVEVDPGEVSSEMPWGLDRLDSKFGLDGQYAVNDPNAGRGAHVYVLDTGIKSTHGEFGGRAVPTLDSTSFMNLKVCNSTDSDCASDSNGHGTSAAATIAGRNVGVAPGAWVHSAKMLNDQGVGTHSSMLMAIDWILANGERPLAIFSSLDSSGALDSKLLQQAVEKANSSNIPFIIGAGDEGKDACKGFPARIPAAFAVASTNKVDQRSLTSNVGNCTSIFAPGEAIRTADFLGDDSYALVSGTSLAAAHVAGAAALAISLGGNRSTKEVYSQITENAHTGILGRLSSGSPNKLLSLDFHLNSRTLVIGKSTFTDSDPRQAKGRKKCIETTTPMTCASNAGNPGFRVGNDESRANFVVTSERDGELICAQRSDTIDDDFLPGRNQGTGDGSGDSGKWDVNLAIKCPLRDLTTPPDKWLFRRLGGNDTLCSGQHAGDRKAINFALFNDIKNFKRCEELCVATSGCNGYGFSGNQCEVWLAKISSFVTVPRDSSSNQTFTCMKLAARGLSGSGFLRSARDPSKCLSMLEHPRGNDSVNVVMGSCDKEFAWSGIGSINADSEAGRICLRANRSATNITLQAAKCKDGFSGEEIFGFQGTGTISTTDNLCINGRAPENSTVLLEPCDRAKPNFQFFY